MRRSWSVLVLCLGVMVLPYETAFGQRIYWLDASFGSPTLNRSDYGGGSATQVPLDAKSLPEGLVVDAAHNTVYFGELAYTNASLNRTLPDLSSITPISSGESVIRGIAVDSAARTIYWTTSNLATGSSIEKADIGGTNRQKVYQFAPGSRANLRGIAVSGTSLYWADFSSGQILRGDVMGSTAPVELIAGLGGPVGVALSNNGFIYWTEANANLIKRRALLSGTITTLVSGLSRPNYIAVDGASGQIFWTEIGVPRIRKADSNGANVQTLPLSVTHPTGIVVTSSTTGVPRAVQDERPLAFGLEQNYPNPFNPSTTIRYSVPRSSVVQLIVFNTLGQPVAELVNGEIGAGYHEVRFDPKGLSSGVYFYRLKTEGFAETRRLLLAR